ncbi:MAG: hypothetical protein JXA73_02770 [Acidobacteria bacterium]|nr:hypothetical protein [Acidobacteriota bacterium]
MGELVIALLELVIYGTGELILYAVTLGRRKPKWPFGTKESVVTQELLFSLSTWVGIIFWGAVLLLIAWLISR